VRALVAAGTLVLACHLSAASAADDSKKTVLKKAVACRDRYTYSRYIRIVMDRDEEAFQRFLARALTTHECVVLQAGQTVYMEDVAMFSGVMKVRPRGEDVGYWVAWEMISK
jgi:hypothetical protein